MKNNNKQLFNSRRNFITTILALGITPITGCRSFNKFDDSQCSLTSMPKASLATTLVIDSHAHTFNASDLQVSRFISLVMSRQFGKVGVIGRVLAPLVGFYAWHKAPSAKRELRFLDTMSRNGDQCLIENGLGELEVFEEKQFRFAINELIRAINQAPEFATAKQAFATKNYSLILSDEDKARVEILQEADRLNQLNYKEYLSANSLLRTSPITTHSVSGVIAFITQLMQFRLSNYRAYISTYDAPNRPVDLILSHLVDYDWWLNKGLPTPSTLDDQVKVMKKISILSGGRVHGFIPFDPLRQIAFNVGYTNGINKWTPLELVKSAIAESGFIGVKLYPPMGFRPLCNADLPSSTWKKKWLPKWISETTDIGVKLDSAMNDLFSWCESHEVPIMAHTRQSNGASKRFEEMAAPEYWSMVLVKYPKLRINFGHFGGHILEEKDAKAIQGYINHMQKDGAGKFAYSDTAFFEEILEKPEKFKKALIKLFAESSYKGEASLQKRMVYGTDWLMTLSEGNIRPYLSGFEEVISDIAANSKLPYTQIEEDFFGLNAARWLGLYTGNGTANRLMEFYHANNVPIPTWYKKININQ